MPRVMDLLQRLPVPKRLAARVWLLTLPSAVLSFERRRRIPKLPAGRARLLGLPLAAAGVAVILRSRPSAHPELVEGHAHPLARLRDRPAVGGGLLALGGVGILMRSLMLIAYAAGLAAAFSREMVDLEDPRLPGGAAPAEPWDYDDTLVQPITPRSPPRPMFLVPCCMFLLPVVCSLTRT